MKFFFRAAGETFSPKDERPIVDENAAKFLEYIGAQVCVPSTFLSII